MAILCAFAEALRSPDLLASARLSPTAFLRQRHLTFPKLLTLMLSGMCGSIQQELDRFASKLQLFLKDATGRKVREAIAFMLYLPGSEMALDFELYAPQVSERQMLFEHLARLRRDDLLVLDRGYQARWLVAVLFARGLHFCMRVDDTGFAEVTRFRRSGDAEAVVTLAPPSAADAADYDCPREALRSDWFALSHPPGGCISS